MQISKGLSALFLGMILLALAVTPLSAATCTLSFGTYGQASLYAHPGWLHEGTQIGQFFYGDEYVSQVFSGTGLTSINHLSLDLVVTESTPAVEGAYVSFGFRVNGTYVGNWVCYYPTIGPVSLSYSFPKIVGNGTYEIKMYVESTTWWEIGAGAICLGASMPLKLSNNPAFLSGAALLLSD